jgi:hypothetical protein
MRSSMLPRLTLFSEILLQGTQILPRFTARSAPQEAAAAEEAEEEAFPEEAAAAEDTASEHSFLRLDHNKKNRISFIEIPVLFYF